MAITNILVRYFLPKIITLDRDSSGNLKVRIVLCITTHNNTLHAQFQYSLSDLIGGSCVGSSQSIKEERRPSLRISRKSWSQCTLNDPFNSSKTLWPVPRFEAMFLPEFPVKETPLKLDYVFLDIISKGTYGRVYKVQKLDTKQVFALKVISKAKIIEESAVIQAKQEVAIQRAVGHHPFVLNASQKWQGRKTLYILTDYIGGGELFSLVEDYGILPEEIVRIYVAEIALAIDFLHNAGVVHRDLKATNILLDEEGHAVIIDFGLAKWLHYTERTNTFCGTPEYMAPEVLKGEYYGQEVDWWSLGVLVCFLLTNKYPSTVRSELLPSREDVDYSPAGSLPADANLSPASEDLLKRLLQPEPRLRLKSVLALQRIAFFMGKDIQTYMLKKESPFSLLGRKSRADLPRRPVVDEFSDFSSSVNGDTNRTGISTYI